jgi:hypothetical protein
MNQMKIAYLIAKTQIGVTEIVGPKHNQKIIEYGQATILQSDTDEESWCSNFVNWCYIIAGLILNPIYMRKLLTGRYSEADIEMFINSAKELAPKIGMVYDPLNPMTAKISRPTMLGNARSFQNFAAVSDGQEGDIVVLWRENPTSWKGHVAFLAKKGLTYVNLLGGNQNNKVCYADYSRTRVLSYRKNA